MGRVVASQSPRRKRKDAPRRTRTDERNGSPRDSSESHTAEHAARKLMTELKSKGYDPRTGGSLLLQGSDSTDDFDKDRYQMTLSEEADKDRYQMTPSEEAALESREDRDESYYRGDTYTEYTRNTEYSRKSRATDYSEASSTRHTAYTESYGEETRDDWTMLDKTVVSSRSDDYTRRGAETVATDDYTRDDSMTYDTSVAQTEYSEAPRVRPPRMRKGYSKPQVSASVASKKCSSSSASSDSEITDKEFDKCISNSFENSIVDATFSKVVGIQEKQQGKRSKNLIKHPPMGDTLNHADKKSNLPTSAESIPSTSRRVKPLGAQSPAWATTHPRGSGQFIEAMTPKSEHIRSPRKPNSVSSRSIDVEGRSPRRPRDSGQFIEAMTSKSEHIRSAKTPTGASSRSPDVVGRSPRHLFPEDEDENEITEHNESNGPTCDDLAAATSAKADSIKNTPSSPRDTGSSRVGLRSMFARPASPAKRDKQRSKAKAVLTKNHPNPGTANTGYSTTSTTPTGGPPHGNQSKPVRSRIFISPDSNAGTEITRRSLSPPKQLRSRIIIRPDSNAGTEITRRSLSPPKRLRILHGPAPPASRTNHFTMKSLIGESVAFTGEDGSVKSLESNKVAPAKKRKLFKRFLKASSGRKPSSTKPCKKKKPKPVKPDFALVSREKLFKELKESGISTQIHQKKPESAGSVLGRLITPRRGKNAEESAGELTEGEWSVVSRESECFSDSECSYEYQKEAGNPRGKGRVGKMKKTLINRMKSSPRAHGESAAYSTTTTDAQFSLPVHAKPFETTNNKGTLLNRMKSSPRGHGGSAGNCTTTTDAQFSLPARDKPSENTEKRSGSRIPTEPECVNSVRLEDNDLDVFSAEGRTISSTKASRGSTVTSLKSMTSKASKSATSNKSKSSAVSKSALSAQSATSNKSKLSENTSIASKASHQTGSSDGIDILSGLAPEENQRGRLAQLQSDTRSPVPDRQGVSSPKKQLPSPKKAISGSVRNESTSPKKLIKKLPPSSPKDKSKEESVSALNVDAPATRAGQPGAASATGTVAKAETGQKPKSRTKFINLFKSAARKQKKSYPKSVGEKLIEETEESVQETVGSGSSSVDPAIDQPVDAANDNATNPTTTNAAAPASAVEAAASAWAFLNHSYAVGKASSLNAKSLFQAEAPDAAERDTDGNIPSENEATKEDSLHERSFKNIDSSAPQIPTETTANSGSKARFLPEVSSEAMFSTGVESGNESQQKETRMNSSSHKNQPEDAALKATPEAREEGNGTEIIESDAIVSNELAPKTRKVQTYTLAQAIACAACQDDKQNMSPQNGPKLDLNKALADTDSSSTRRSQSTSENSTGTDSATAEPGLAAEMPVDGKHPVDNPGTQKQLPTGTNENTNYAACGSLGFMFNENPASLRAAPDRKGVRFSEDLEFVRVIPPDSVSVAETLDSSPSVQSQENERANGGEVFPRVTGPSSKKKGIFSWIRRDSRGRAKQLTSRKSQQAIQEEEPEDMDDMEPDEGSDSAEVSNEERTAGSDDSVNPSPVRSKGDVVSNTAMEAPGKGMHSRKHQRHTSPKATTKHSSKEKSNRKQAVPIGQRVPMKEGGGDGNGSSMPLPPPEEEGIELIARRTKTGKNAILIAKTGNPRFDIPTRHHNIVKSEYDSSLEGKRKIQRKSPKNIGKPKQKAPLRLRFFKSNNENDVSTVTLPRKGLKSRMPQHKPRNRRKGSSRVQHHNRNGSLSTEATEGDSASNSFIQDGFPNTHTNGVPRLSPANHEIAQHPLNAPLDRVNSETVLSPVGLRKQDHTDNLNQNSYTVASGHTDQAMRDASEATGFGHGAMSVTSFGSSTHLDQGTRYTQVSDGVSTTGGDWFSWLMPGIFAPIPRPKQAKQVDRSAGRFLTDDLSQETGSVISNKIQDDQWREILDATETLAIRYKEQRAVGDDDASDRSISEESIKEVNDAITKFREHAARLGMRERELMAAVRDDDRILHSGPRQDGTAARVENPRKQQTGFVSRMGNATDKFIDVFDFYFSQNDAMHSHKQ